MFHNIFFVLSKIEASDLNPNVRSKARVRVKATICYAKFNAAIMGDHQISVKEILTKGMSDLTKRGLDKMDTGTLDENKDNSL